MLFRISCSILIIFVIKNISCEIDYNEEEPQVRFSNGAILSGYTQESRGGRTFSSFKGIPYATVPERFAESQLIEQPTWEGVKEAKKPGPMCPQIMELLGGKLEGLEECLVLNVHVPKDNPERGKKLYPVMVYIHGGGFVGGSGDLSPHYFLDEDIIFVTINYRVGILGFLSTGDEVVPGNMGLKDQVIALRWVQKNIKSFGGDPDKVTIAGISAGGASVHHLMLSPMAKGLFHGAIAQSGSAFSTWSFSPNVRDKSVELATYLKCPTTASAPSHISSKEIAECFKGISMEELIKASFSFRTYWPMNLLPVNFSPTSEPEATSDSKHTPFLTKSPWSQKVSSEVPLIIGATEDEGANMFASLVVRKPDLLKEINNNWNEVATNAFFLHNHLSCPKALSNVAGKIKEFYFGTKEISKETESSLSDLYSDAIITDGVRKAAIQVAKTSNNPVYLYQFARPNPFLFMALMLGLNDTDPKKVGHGDEAIFQFDFSKGDMGFMSAFGKDSEEERFSQHFISLWAKFVTTGLPNYSWGSGEKWEPISDEELSGVKPLKWYRIESDPKSIDDPYKERADFWDQIWFENFLLGDKNCKKDEGTKKKTEL